MPYAGDRAVDGIGAVLSMVGMGGVVLGVLVWQEGGESVAALLALGLVALGALVYWLVRRKREGKPTLLDPSLFSSKLFSFGIAQGILQQIALGGMLIALPIYFQLVLGYNALEAGLTLAPLSLTMFGVALLAGRRAGRRRPSSLIRAGFALVAAAMVTLIPIVPSADSGWYINTDARHLALQVVLLVTLLSALIGLFNALRMMRLPDPRPSASAEGMALG